MITTQQPARWIVRPTPNPGAVIRLFCFPYAGGSASLFHSWPNGLPETVEVCAVELPGRGKRLQEPPIGNWTTLLEELTGVLHSFADKPFGLFGHSLGAIIGFEVARQLHLLYGLAPQRLFVAGCAPPRSSTLIERLLPKYPIHKLPEQAFLREVAKHAGTPREVLGNSELMRLAVPRLRADFELSETYGYDPQKGFLDCPITALGGSKDSVSWRSLRAWRHQTSGAFSCTVLPGHHFFLKTAEELLLQIVSKELGAVAGTPAPPPRPD